MPGNHSTIRVKFRRSEYKRANYDLANNLLNLEALRTKT